MTIRHESLPWVSAARQERRTRESCNRNGLQQIDEAFLLIFEINGFAVGQQMQV